ncbi:MAG: carboxypeptidase regulatory-like domain-containing protein [Bryobacterales bacterium]|nr:carboxypeptidase regulatory-like domain-containing protein [Bryobacterales bacterium]
MRKSPFVVLSLFLCALAVAQEFRATLTGRVTDASGGAVAGAKVEVKSATTGAVQSTVSQADGSYQVPFLTPGEYAVTVEKEGFRRAVREGIRLQVAEKASLDFSLQLGEVSQSVTVEANTSVLETETADRGLAIENNRILNTPLQGRNVFANVWSAPGVTVTAAVQRLRPFDIAGSSSIAISGGQPSGNEVLIDGVSNLARAGQVAYVPQVEATGEVKVQTTMYDAQNGWTTGGVVNVITKSGGNDFHGTVFEFLQNTHLNANTFDSNRNGIGRSSSHINTYGGDINGPIRKNKIFGAFSYEKIDQVIPDPFLVSVPTALQKSGDFSQTYYSRNASGQLLAAGIYDPFSTHADSTGKLIRDPFPGNQIPANRINPIAKNVLNLIPLGNVAGNAITGLSNLASTGGTRKFTDFFPQYTGRVDYNISDSTRMFVRYSRNALAEERDFKYSTNSAFNVADTSSNSPFKRENHSATIQLTKTLSANSVLDFRAGLARFLGQSGSSIGANFDLASLGFSSQFIGQAARFFPKFNWVNYQGAGSSPVNNDPIAQTNSFQGTYMHIMGKHSLKTGGEFRLQRAYRRVPGFSAGNFNFDIDFTGANPISKDASSGNAIASFLLGTATAGSYIDVNSFPALQQRLFSWFVQDDIRVTSRLKLNLGLRWDYLGPMTDRFNALNRGFDRTSPSPLKAPGVDLKGGLLFAGTGGMDRGIYDRSWGNFGPRLGFAYSLRDKTVIRGGYGLIYGQTFDDPGSAPGFSQRTDMVTSIRTGIPENTLTIPFPAGILRPVGNSLGLATFLGQGFNFNNPGRNIPMTHQFSLEVQRELPWQMMMSVGYVGSRIERLQVNQSINEIPLSALALGASELTRNVPNPLAGLIPGTGLNGATVQQQQLLRPFIQFTGLTQLFNSIGDSRYDSLQALLYKRLSSGLNVSVSYTYSRTFEHRSFANAQDTQLIRLPAQWDIPNNLQLNGVYDLPFGQGKKFASHAPRGLKQLISGWQISGIARIQQGWPLELGANTVPTGVSPKLDNPNRDRWFNTCTLLSNGATRGCLQGETPVWTVRQPFQLQTWSNRITWVRRPGIKNLDASILKNTHITEKVLWQFRADFLNATNTVQFFNGPITDVNNGLFGRLAGAVTQSNLPRFIQLSMRVQF